MRKQKTILLGSILLLSVLTGMFYIENIEAAEQNEEFYPTDDAYVNFNTPEDNYNTNRLVVSNDTWFLQESYIKFDLTSIHADSTLTVANLKLYVDFVFSCSKVYVWAANSVDSWAESTLAWDTKPSRETYVGELTITDAKKWYSMDILTEIQDSLLDGHVTLILVPDNEDGILRICSKENMTDIPTLELTYNPPMFDPTAAFSAETNAGLKVKFNASDSEDPYGQIVSYEWDFGDGETGTGTVIEHIYATEGEYTVTLNVTDDDGNKSTAIETYSLSNSAPTADYSFDVLYPELEDTVTFTDLSEDLDGTITNWSWDFGDREVSYEENPTHEYSDEGAYDVTLTVKDNHDATSQITKQIITKTVYSEALNAGENYVDQKNDFDLYVVVDANNDTTIYVSKYFDNPTGQDLSDNTYSIGNYLDIEVENWSRVNPPMQIRLYYTQADLDDVGVVEEQLQGIYFWNGASWELYDTTGVNTAYSENGYVGYCWANVSHLTNITIGARDNQKPTVSVTSPGYGESVSGTITIEGTATDPDGNSDIEKVELQIDSGAWFEASGTSSWEYSWNSASVSDDLHELRARAWDGLLYSDVKLIQFSTDNQDDYVPPPDTGDDTTDTTDTTDPGDGEEETEEEQVLTTNQPPVADAGGPYEEYVNVEITFDGSGSTDEASLEYYWNFGEGEVGRGVRPTHTYTKPGEYTVELVVYDPASLSGSDTVKVTVLPPPNNPPTEPVVTSTLNGTGTQNSVYTFYAISTDSDNDSLKYTFDWGDGTDASVIEFTAHNTTVSAMHSWKSSGMFTIDVTADDNKTTSSTSYTVYIDLIEVNVNGTCIGQLTDDNSDGIYDTFHPTEGNETDVTIAGVGIYCIDTDGDGEPNYEFDTTTNSASLYTSIPTDGADYMLVVVGAAAIIIIAILFVFYSHISSGGKKFEFIAPVGKHFITEKSKKPKKAKKTKKTKKETKKKK